MKSILFAKIMLSQKFLILNLILNKLQAFHFHSTVHTNTTTTRTCYKNHLSATIMVIKIELKIVNQIAWQAVFGQKSVNAETLKAIVCQTAPLAKLPPGGFLFIHEI